MSSKIVVTVCSVNYLASAKGLADSMIKYNPDYKVVIGLVDRLDNNNIDISSYQPHRLLQVHEMKVPAFDEMRKRYNIFELNCALKSFFVRWTLDEFNPQYVIYLDVDMLVYDSFLPIEAMLKDSSILITPHITRPFPDKHRPAENDILKTGMFNAGFFAVNNDPTGNSLINWWKERMIDQGYERPKDGYNSDQNWLNFVPLYFDKVKIIRHPGCNTAYWNFHERNIEKKGDRFFVNNEPLIFFHYSGYSFQNPEKISKHQDRFSMQDNMAIKEIFNIYQKTLEQNGHEALQKIPCYYKKPSGGWLKKSGLRK